MLYEVITIREKACSRLKHFYMKLETRYKRAKRLRLPFYPCIVGVLSFIVCCGLPAHVGLYRIIGGGRKHDNKTGALAFFTFNSHVPIVLVITSYSIHYTKLYDNFV